MTIYAISDLHLNHKINREALKQVGNYPDDWLVLAGDICESEDVFIEMLELLTQRFYKIFWVPGNHDLWTIKKNGGYLSGEPKYLYYVELCRKYSVLTPEDPYEQINIEGQNYIFAPLMILFDYSFRPNEIKFEHAINWAMEAGIVSSDEMMLQPEPYPSIVHWCYNRVEYTEKRLQEVADQGKLILINHYPLIERTVHLPRIPRFSMWCGTKKTHNWHKKFPVEVVIYGHLHIRGTYFIDNVRFEEVSLGYPRNWNQNLTIDSYFRKIF